MSRSRSFNRFHRQLARQKRHALRSLIPRLRNRIQSPGKPLNHSHARLDRVNGRDVVDELLESET